MARSVVIDILARDRASATLSKVASSAELTAARFARAGDRMIATSRTLNRRLTLPILAIGAASVKMATDFNSAMTRIQTQAGGSARDVRILSKQVLDLAKSAQQGPVELANALYHLKSVGMSNVAAMKALKQASDLAAVGHAGLEETTNALAGAWRTGIRGAKNFHQTVASLNAIIGAGNMKMEDLNAALGTGILPAAKTFGLSLKDVGSALALFTDEGVPADAAATRLRMTFSLMGAPSKQAAKSLIAIGLSSDEAGKRVKATQELLTKAGVTTTRLGQDMRKPNGLIRAVADLKTHLGHAGLSAVQQSALLSRAFGGGRSSAAILSMVNNYEVLAKKQRQVTKLQNRFNDSVKAQRATPEAKFKLLESSLQRAAILLGNQLLPLAVKAANKLAKWAEKFNGLSSGWKKFIAYAALAVAALGPVLAIGGRLVKVFGLLWRVNAASSRFLAGQTAAQRSMQATAASATAVGTAAQGQSAKMTAASLKVEASQLSQQAAVQRSAALIAVAESEKANAAVRTAEIMERSAASAGGAEAVLAARAGTDARLFAAAKAAEADAAVKAAATIEAASIQATRALGRAQRTQQGFYARNRAGLGMGLGLGLGIGLPILGNKVGGRGGKSLSYAGYGALAGSMFGPEGTLIGAGIGGLYGALNPPSKERPPSFLTAAQRNSPTLASRMGGAMLGGGKSGKGNKFWDAIRNVEAYDRALKVAVREQDLFSRAADRSGNVVRSTAKQIAGAALRTSGLSAAAKVMKVSQGELTTAVTGSNDQYARMRKLLADSGASDAFLTALDKMRQGFNKGTGSAILMRREAGRLQRAINAIKQAHPAAVKVETSAAAKQIATLQAMIDNLNGTTISVATQSVKSANIAELLHELQTGQITQAQFDKAYKSAGGTATSVVKVTQPNKGAATGAATSAAGSGAAAPIKSLAADAQKNLAALRVKIRHGDLTAIRKALHGTVDETRAAFQQMFADVRAAGGSSIIGLLKSGEQRLLAFQAKLTNARTYQAGVRSTLAGTFDATKYGSIQDLLGGLGGQTSQNKAYKHEVTKLRREARHNPRLLRFINQLAAQGQSATLETLAGASKTQLAQVAKAVGGYNASLTAGSKAAEEAKFGQSINKMVKHQHELTSAIAALARAFADHPVTVEIDGHKVTKRVLNDPQFERLLLHIANLAENGRAG